ncbi:GNAT family N-acetyltransferase [Terrihabitans sp. B22-R8]|uniref:GNAT family N-acetyltransferase n=1 Tax=Terrihabitans sp. B22-R8 TaxID=3425128 RepID=UPI00403C5AE2
MEHAEWRPLHASDLNGVMAVQQEAYPRHQEEREVFEDRLALYPTGCFALDWCGGLLGYAISHPWRAASPPPLGRKLGNLPSDPSTYYLHDLALAKRAHGGGHARRGVKTILNCARRHGFQSASLVAVNATSPFWQRQGFLPAMTPELTEKLASYGADAIFMTRALARDEPSDAACPSPQPPRMT